MFMGFLMGTYAVFLSGVPYLYLAYVLIGVGLFIILISIIGCIAAAKDSGCWLLTVCMKTKSYVSVPFKLCKIGGICI